jgi:hypothetical protein
MKMRTAGTIDAQLIGCIGAVLTLPSRCERWLARTVVRIRRCEAHRGAENAAKRITAVDNVMTQV